MQWFLTSLAFALPIEYKDKNYPYRDLTSKNHLITFFLPFTTYTPAGS